jgi:hypothetical protein
MAEKFGVSGCVWRNHNRRWGKTQVAKISRRMAEAMTASKRGKEIFARKDPHIVETLGDEVACGTIIVNMQEILSKRRIGT